MPSRASAEARWNEGADQLAKQVAAVAKEDGCLHRVAQLEKAFAALIDAVDAKDKAAVEQAMFVGRGLLF